MRNRRLLASAAAGLAVLAAVTVASPASAAPTPQRAASCSSGTFCIWTGAGYSGRAGVLAARPNGTCYDFYGGYQYRSYINRSSIEGYFYDGIRCSGSARAVTHDSQNPDLGFAAASFRYACVSCRAGGE